MSLFHPVSASEKPKHQGFPYLNVPVSPSERPTPKTLSIVDVQALALILMILTVVSMPIYRSVLDSQGKRAPSPVAVAHSAPLKTARAGKQENANAEQESRKKGIQEKREEKKERNLF